MKRLISYKAPNLNTILGGSKTAGGKDAAGGNASLMDHNNLPYAWRSAKHGHADGEKSDAALRKNARQARVRPLKGGLSSSKLLQASASTPSLSSTTTTTTTTTAARIDVGTQPTLSRLAARKEDDQESSKVETSPPPLETTISSTTMTTPPAPPPAPPSSHLPLGFDEPVPGWWDQPSFTRLDQSRMPLEAFDDASLEYKSSSKSPQEWLQECRTGKVKYYADGTWRWRKVIINSYNVDLNKFNVTFDGPTQRPKRLTKDVRRLDLMFTDEDSELFEQRRQAAESYREQFKGNNFLETRRSSLLSQRIRER